MSTQWGTITGDINDQQDLVDHVNNTKSGCTHATPTTIGTIKIDPTIDIQSDGTISAAWKAFLGDKLKVLTTPTISTADGNCFYYVCNSDTEFTLSSSSGDKYRSLYLFVSGGEDYAISWSPVVNWHEGITPVFTSGIDCIYLMTCDNGVTWCGYQIMSAIGDKHINMFTDTEGVKHKDCDIVDDGTYSFDGDGIVSKINENIGGPLSFDSLTSVTTPYFMSGLMDVEWFVFKRLSVTSVRFPALTEINGEYCFSGFMNKNSTKLSVVDFPVLKTISSGEGIEYPAMDCAFFLTKIDLLNFPELETVSDAGLQNAFPTTKISTINMPKLTAVRNYGMMYTFDSSLFPIDVEFPKLAEISGSGLEGCFEYSKITGINFPSLTTVTDRGMAEAFAYCYNLKTLNMPLLEEIGTEGCSCMCVDDSSLTSLSFPSLVTVETNGLHQAFSDCTNVTTVNLPLLESVGDQGLYRGFACTKIRTISFPSLAYIGTEGLLNVFEECEDLEEVHFRADMEEDESFVEQVDIAAIPETATVYWDL